MSSRKRHKKFRWFVALLVLGALFISYKTTRSNWFCSLCHSMSPYAASWTRDPAHRDVPCVECHLPRSIPAQWYSQVRYVVKDTIASLKSGENQRFIAHVPDENCLRQGCHQDENWDAEAANERKRSLQAFRHNTHFEEQLKGGLTLQCTSCHAGDAGNKKHHFSLASDNCYSCHLPLASSESSSPSAKAANTTCMMCHPKASLSKRVGHPEKGEDSSKVPSGLVDMLSCSSCHPFFAETVLPVEDRHCLACHPDWGEGNSIQASEMHTLHVLDKRADCHDCHEIKRHRRAFRTLQAQIDCSECHEEREKRTLVQTEVYTGRAVGFSLPDPMALAGVTCQACHVRTEKGCSDGRKSCSRCHVAGYTKLVPKWQATIKAKVFRLNRLLEKAVEQKRIPEYPPLVKDFIDVLKMDGSMGVHNIFVINDLLNRSIDMILSLFAEEATTGTGEGAGMTEKNTEEKTEAENKGEK